MIMGILRLGYKINIGSIKMYARSNLIYYFCLTSAFYTKDPVLLLLCLKILLLLTKMSLLTSKALTEFYNRYIEEIIYVCRTV